MSLTEWVHKLSLVGGADEQAGCVQDAGMFAMLFVHLAKRQGEEEWIECGLTEEDEAFLKAHPHCILTEGSQGFIDADWYSDAEEAWTVWEPLAEKLDSYLIDTSIDE